MSLNRRKILKIGIGIAGYAMLSKISLAAGSEKVSAKTIAIKPIEGQTYSASFLRFAERARFLNPRDAIASVRDRSISYDLVCVK